MIPLAQKTPTKFFKS